MWATRWRQRQQWRREQDERPASSKPRVCVAVIDGCICTMKPHSSARKAEDKKGSAQESRPFLHAARKLRGLFHERLGRRRNRIRQTVVVGLHRNDLRRRLGPRRLLF